MSETITSFPTVWDAPFKLLQMESHCGLLTAWTILKFLRKRTSSIRLIEMCHHNRNGIHLIALAVTLRRHGLRVSFFSEPDPKPTIIEKRCYRVAGKIGIELNHAISLDDLLSRINSKSIAAVFFQTSEGNGHLTPLLGEDEENLIMPVTDEGVMPKREFLKGWSEPEIFRQCLIASV